MKATGIIRRVDDLGRIVIPKEIRRRLNVHEGDPMELYLTDEGIVFQPYHIRLQDEISAILQTVKENYHIDVEEQERIIKILEKTVEELDKI